MDHFDIFIKGRADFFKQNHVHKKKKSYSEPRYCGSCQLFWKVTKIGQSISNENITQNVTKWMINSFAVWKIPFSL